MELSPLGSNIILNGHNNVNAHSSTLGKTFPLQGDINNSLMAYLLFCGRFMILQAACIASNKVLLLEEEMQH